MKLTVAIAVGVPVPRGLRADIVKAHTSLALLRRA